MGVSAQFSFDLVRDRFNSIAAGLPLLKSVNSFYIWSTRTEAGCFSWGSWMQSQVEQRAGKCHFIRMKQEAFSETGTRISTDTQ